MNKKKTGLIFLISGIVGAVVLVATAYKLTTGSAEKKEDNPWEVE